MNNKLKIKVNKRGECDELTFNGETFGERIEKLTIIIDACKPLKIIAEAVLDGCELDLEGKQVDVEIKRKP